MFSPSPPCVRWWKTIPIKFRRILLVSTTPHAKCRRTVYTYIPGGLVTYDTLHKGTSKQHKTDRKNHQFCSALSSIKIWNKNIISPIHPSHIQKCSGLYIKNTNVDRETCTAILSFFWGLVSTQKCYLFVELSFFWFILVHTQVRQAKN